MSISIQQIFGQHYPIIKFAISLFIFIISIGSPTTGKGGLYLLSTAVIALVDTLLYGFTVQEIFMI